MANGALRERQVGLTRDLIMEALAGVIAEGRLAEFSVQDVAEGAGTSLRTVYRHFPSREALLEAFIPWGEARFRAMGGMRLPRDADDLANHVRIKFAAMEQFAPLLSAANKLDVVTGIRNANAERGFLALRFALAEVTAGLDPAMAETVAWTIRQICAPGTGLRLHEEGGIDAAHAGAAAGWAVQLLVAALREGKFPQMEREGRHD